MFAIVLSKWNDTLGEVLHHEQHAPTAWGGQWELQFWTER